MVIMLKNGAVRAHEHLVFQAKVINHFAWVIRALNFVSLNLFICQIEIDLPLNISKGINLVIILAALEGTTKGRPLRW